MTAALLTLLVVAFVSGLAVLAQMGRKSRGADVTLIVVVLALSVLGAALGTLTGLGLLLMAFNGSPGGAPGAAAPLAFAAAGGIALLVGLAGVGLCIPPLRRVTGRQGPGVFWADPPVFLALWLFVVVLGNNVISLLLFDQLPDLASIIPTGRLSPTSVLTSQLPFLVLAILGVGFGVRRGARETLQRLGYGRLSPGNLGAIVLFVAAALALSLAADALFSVLQPDLYREVGRISENLFDPTGLSPGSAVLFALVVGVGAGLGEETLFRGAVQPRLGIVATSVLFTSMHVQYGPSVLLGFVLLLSLGLGLIRERINTTASFVAHAAYNALAILLTYYLA